MGKVNDNVCFFLCLLLMPLLIFSRPTHATQWDVEYWQYVNWKNWGYGCYKLSTLGEIRTNHDLSRFYYCRLTESFAYHVLPNLDLEAHYSFIYNKSRGASQFSYTNRLEFEANPSMQLNNGVTLKWRNRLEFIKRQHICHVNYVLRHRIKSLYPIENWGNLKSLGCSNEIYYDLATHKLTQNRLIPLELTFALNPKTTLDVFLMIRDFFSSRSSQWYRSIVIGSEFGF